MEKIKQYIRDKKVTEQDILDRLTLQDLNPSIDFYRTIVSASAQINDLIRTKTLDLDDPYQKSLLRLLESGDKVSKTLKNAQLDAYPQEDNDDQSIGDMLSSKKNGNK